MVTCAQAAYEGPVPPSTDAFGGPGPYTVVEETLPSPLWPGQVVTVFRPSGAVGRRPAWFFAHGFGGTNPTYYRELLNHLASHGAIVVFSPYPVSSGGHPDEAYAILFEGFVAAANRFSDQIDTSRVGFAGHSYGGGAVPALALRAVRDRGWGGNGLALMLLAPWYSFFVSDADLGSFPSRTQAVVEVYEDDLINDHRMAIDVFTHLNLPANDKDYLMVRSDRISGYNYNAEHTVPTGAGNPRPGNAFDALDSWAVLRIAQALTASAFQDDQAAHAVALGNGSAMQTQMGATPDGRAIRPMTQSDAPSPLFPESRCTFGFHRSENPRRNTPLPESPVQPRLVNLSARAKSAGGADVLIVGAVVAGDRPKSLLIRAVGPGLRSYGVANPMPDPRLISFRGAAPDIDIDDWSETPSVDALNAATSEVGAFNLTPDSNDAAVLMSFSPGAITAHAVANDTVAGVTLLELYDADLSASATLRNLSARARVGSGEDLLIAGFVTSGNGDLHLLIRGIGPALIGLGVADALPDPVLEIYRGSERIAINDNWSADAVKAAEIAAAATKVGAFPLAAGSSDASILLALPPGAYTAHVRPNDGHAGVGLVEIYVVP